MPRPVEALPCGSRSMISTRSPMAASAVPRLIAVVVLPTPPFSFAIASTRGGGAGGRGSAGNCRISPRSVSSVMACIHWGRRGPGSLSPGAASKLVHHHDSACQICPTIHQFMVNFPIFGGLGQFGLYILALWQQAFYTNFHERHHVSKQSFQRCECPGGDDVNIGDNVRRQVLDAQVMNARGQRQFAGDVTQEGGLLGGALDQMHHPTLPIRK